MGLWAAIGEAIFHDDRRRADYERELREKRLEKLREREVAALERLSRQERDERC